VFAQMNGVVRAIDYLPFRYKLDGCYARALYMSMELASHSLESNAVFAFAKPGHVLTVGSIEWGYHVAPMLEVGPNGTHLVPMVLDPSLASTPLTLAQWADLMGYPSLQTEDAPTTLMVPGSEYGPVEAQQQTTWKNRDVPDFADLPAFRVTDVQSACGVMFTYLAEEPAADDATSADAGAGAAHDAHADAATTADAGAGTPPVSSASAKQEKLVKRTVELLAGLEALKKIDHDMVFSEARCRRGDF